MWFSLIPEVVYSNIEKRTMYGDASSRNLLATFLDNLPSGKLLLMAAREGVNIDSDLALALHKVGVSATFATSPVPDVFLSLAYVGFN